MNPLKKIAPILEKLYDFTLRITEQSMEIHGEDRWRLVALKDGDEKLGITRWTPDDRVGDSEVAGSSVRVVKDVIMDADNNVLYRQNKDGNWVCEESKEACSEVCFWIKLP